MGPSSGDLAVARGLCDRLVAAGRGRVRRVVMIGSRARGTPRPDSDLDLVVIVEIPPGERPWANPEIAAERRRLQGEVGRPPLPTDLWVRTTDRFEECRSVVGGVESLVESEGVDLFSRPMDRAPIVRRPPEQVRIANTCGWLEDGVAALTRARTAGSRPGLRLGTAPVADEALFFAEKAVRCAINALFVKHQVLVSKQDSLEVVLARLRGLEPPLASLLEARLGDGGYSPGSAGVVVDAVAERLARDPELAKPVLSIRRRLGSA